MKNKLTAYFILVCFVQSIFVSTSALADAPSNQYAVAFLGSPTTIQAKAFKVLGKRIQTWMENGPFGSVQVKTLNGNVSDNELVMEKIKSDMAEYTRTLKKAVLESSDKTKGDKSVAEIKKLRKKMNLVSRFGPLLYKSYLTEAALLWKNDRFQESETALKKAMELYPLGQPSLEDWDMFAQSFSVFAFEKEVTRVYQKRNQYCDTTISIKQNNTVLRVNGFEVNEKRNFKLAANAMHSISLRDDKGHMLESVVHCPRKSQKKLALDLMKSPNVSSEMSFSEALASANAQGLFVASFKKETLELSFYSSKGGTTPLQLEHKLTEKQLAEGSVDLKVPLSYATMNQVLAKHFGVNATMVASNLSRDGKGSSLEEKFRNSGNKWYNNPILLGVVGGLAVGSATAYLLTREGGNPSPKASVTMEMQ